MASGSTPQSELAYWNEKLKQSIDSGDESLNGLTKWGASLLEVSRFSGASKRQKLIEEAKEKLLAAIGKDPKHHQALYLLGLAHSYSGDSKQAKKYFIDAEKNDATNELYQGRASQHKGLLEMPATVGTYMSDLFKN